MIALSLLLSTLTVAPPTTGAELEWFDGPLTSAVGQAAQDDALVMVYFWRNGSDHCTQLYQETLSNERAVKALASTVCYSANYDDAAGSKLFGRFNVTTLPTILFLKGGEREDGVRAWPGPRRQLVHPLFSGPTPPSVCPGSKWRMRARCGQGRRRVFLL